MGALRPQFGKNLRRLRLANRLTQEQLASGAGMDPKYLGAVERGQENISLDRIERLARALGVDAAELLRDDEGPADASLDRFLRRATVLLRRSDAGKRRLMLRLMEDVAVSSGRGGRTGA